MKPLNYVHSWCQEMVARLLDLGVDHFFIAPGSRSTPLVSAIVRNPRAKTFLSIDERSLAFMAQGFAKANKRAGAVVVTSGTAVANLYPAVVEAFLSKVPLLLLTADRPYELRDCGANQTIFQANLFNNHINKSFDLAPPDMSLSLEQSLAIFEQAEFHTRLPSAGPVHINLQFREPLSNQALIAECFDPSCDLPKPLSSKRTLLEGELNFFDEGLLVVGELLPSTLQEQILLLSERLNWPIFADITSNLRLSGHPHVLHHFDLALLNDDFIAALSVKQLIKFGSRVVSKRFWQWVKKTSCQQFMSINDSYDRIDPSGKFFHVFAADMTAYVSTWLEKIPPKRSTFLQEIQKKHSLVASKVEQFLEHKANNEGFLAARLVAQIPSASNLMVSSSMPIRDLDQFVRPTTTPIFLYANRGASGIDGVLSSALGIACATTLPTILLMGDLAFLHDSNGLMLFKQATAPLLIVVVNNGGGGIFHFLPIASEADVLSPFIDTPHQVRLVLLAQAHGIAHEEISDLARLDEAIRQFYEDKQSKILEVKIERDENVFLHKNFYRVLEQLDFSQG